MVERTKRDEEDRKREDEAVGGQPTDAPTPPDARKPDGSATTRDRGVDPAADAPKPTFSRV